MERVTIRGTREGLIISLGEGPLFEVLEEMENRLSTQASFFRGGRVALHTGEWALSEEQLRAIGNLLEGLGVSLWAVETEHPETEVAARELGLEVRTHLVEPPEAQPPDLIPREERPGMVVRRTLRSGQALHHTGHVVLIGDVNPGAEIIAGGDIVIWGKLRGTAHAGAMGDERALICALQLMPSQIRIGSLIARPPDRGRPPKVPEVASVQKGRIVVERWNKIS
ncbi:MAG: septum site-determining protein MinC [Anaerolineae bacterium]